MYCESLPQSGAGAPAFEQEPAPVFAPSSGISLEGKAATAPALLSGSKRSYVTRRVDASLAAGVVLDARAPAAGDIVAARIVSLGQHRHIEQRDGRRARLFEGDLIVAAYGERYATDQFHARLPRDLGECSLVCAGGVASAVVDKHASMKRATRIKPVGILVNNRGEALNISNFALRPSPKPHSGPRRPIVIAVVGSAMNAGKTTTAANIIRSLTRAGLKTGACKLTGTGAGGDCWLFKDAGADPVFDFTDAGFASTYNAPVDRLEAASSLLLSEVFAAGAEAVVVEIADGVLQQETAALLRSPVIRKLVDSIVFAAGDPIAAAAGVRVLSDIGYAASAISGVVTASPLAASEAARATGLPVLGEREFASPDGSLTAILQPSHLRGAGDVR